MEQESWIITAVFTQIKIMKWRYTTEAQSDVIEPRITVIEPPHILQLQIISVSDFKCNSNQSLVQITVNRNATEMSEVEINISVLFSHKILSS